MLFQILARRKSIEANRAYGREQEHGNSEFRSHRSEAKFILGNCVGMHLRGTCHGLNSLCFAAGMVAQKTHGEGRQQVMASVEDPYMRLQVSVSTLTFPSYFSSPQVWQVAAEP